MAARTAPGPSLYECVQLETSFLGRSFRNSLSRMGVAVMVVVSYWHRGTSARSLGTEPMGLIVWIVSHGSIFHYPIIIHSLLIRHKRGRSPNLKLNYPVIFARFLGVTGNFSKYPCMVRPCQCQWRARVSEICQVFIPWHLPHFPIS